jgi:hypothetical protein
MIRDDGITPSRASSHDPIPESGEPERKPRAKNKLDNAKNKTLLSKLRDWYEQEEQRQAHNRYQMALDEDYYDGDSDDEEAFAGVRG